MSQHLSGMEQAGAMDGKNSLHRDGHTSKAAEQRKDSKVQKRAWDFVPRQDEQQNKSRQSTDDNYNKYSYC